MSATAPRWRSPPPRAPAAACGSTEPRPLQGRRSPHLARPRRRRGLTPASRRVGRLPFRLVQHLRHRLIEELLGPLVRPLPIRVKEPWPLYLDEEHAAAVSPHVEDSPRRRLSERAATPPAPLVGHAGGWPMRRRVDKATAEGPSTASSRPGRAAPTASCRRAGRSTPHASSPESPDRVSRATLQGVPRLLRGGIDEREPDHEGDCDDRPKQVEADSVEQVG
jgi:hypothetical protein